ncbi:hypothetical protein M3Y94_00210300 [Aphelenchoides besseyi]|nr:hypothetical protein M3Y94_00210300 [Aphelenchoides besseyi]KAI6236629.1 hypothetical protein M3Y95_00178000 [Aphelenchoides besseyi]
MSIVLLFLFVISVGATVTSRMANDNNINYNQQKIIEQMAPCVSISTMIVLSQKNAVNASLEPEEAEKIIIECLEKHNFTHFIFFHNIEKISDSNETYSPCVADYNTKTLSLKKMEIVEEGGDYCNFLTNSLNPWYCAIRHVCGATLDADLIYAVGYVMQQYAVKTDQALKCQKLPENEELLGQMINPMAYTSDFDVHRDKLLVGNICTLPNGLQYVSSQNTNISTTVAPEVETETPRPSIPRFIRLPVGDAKRYKQPQYTRLNSV